MIDKNLCFHHKFTGVRSEGNNYILYYNTQYIIIRMNIQYSTHIIIDSYSGGRNLIILH